MAKVINENDPLVAEVNVDSIRCESYNQRWGKQQSKLKYIKTH